jgi:hypothetical protein
MGSPVDAARGAKLDSVPVIFLSPFLLASSLASCGELIYQTDGNVVVYNTTTNPPKAKWNSRTEGQNLASFAPSGRKLDNMEQRAGMYLVYRNLASN